MPATGHLLPAKACRWAHMALSSVHYILNMLLHVLELLLYSARRRPLSVFDSRIHVHIMTWLCWQLQDAAIARALAVLFVAHFDPATQDKPRLRQCLSVFFPAYAAASSSHQHHIARAFRRAARGALGVAPIKKAPAPQLMRYMLQVSTASRHRHTLSISICYSHLSCCLFCCSLQLSACTGADIHPDFDAEVGVSACI